MPLLLTSSPHAHAKNTTQRVMLSVILATLPGLFALTYFFGFGSLKQVIWCSFLAVTFEAFVLLMRKKSILFYLSDFSACVTAVLFALAIPPFIPWWMTMVGMFFAIVVAKHFYGGLGQNPFNPAMVGYALLLVSFPEQMTNGPLALAGDGLFNNAAIWVNLAFLLGGLFLIYKKIITWTIPLAVLSSLGLSAALGYFIQPSLGLPLTHLLSGGIMLGAFFIATEPVCAATSNKGKWLYGLLMGILIYCIRTFGAYYESLAFSVLIMNMLAPTIDYFSQPRTYGHDKPTLGPYNSNWTAKDKRYD